MPGLSVYLEIFVRGFSHLESSCSVRDLGSLGFFLPLQSASCILAGKNPTSRVGFSLEKHCARMLVANELVFPYEKCNNPDGDVQRRSLNYQVLGGIKQS